MEKKKKNERLADPCISEACRYGGGASLRVWAGISGWRHIDLVIQGTSMG